MATLGVQEAMGLKVDREAVATLVLPQLWAMSMGPRTLGFINLPALADTAMQSSLFHSSNDSWKSSRN